MARPFRLKSSPANLLALMLVLWAGDHSRAATVGDKVASRSAQAEEAYRGGAFDEALRLYRDAQLEDPDSPALHYNIGDALYKLQQYDAAAEEFQRAAAAGEAVTPNLGAGSWYNLGNTLFQQQQYAEAVEAYKNALMRNSGDVEAKANLEMALARLQQQQPSEDGEEGEENRESQQQQQQQLQQPEEGEQERESEESADSGENQQEQSPEHTPEKEPGNPDQPVDEIAGEMDEEEAEQLLEALRDRETEAQRRRFRVVPRGRTHDW